MQAVILGVTDQLVDAVAVAESWLCCSSLCWLLSLARFALGPGFMGEAKRFPEEWSHN